MSAVQLALFPGEPPVGDRDCWRTPRDLFNQLNREFCFDVDAAADESNHLLPRWWGPGGEFEDALSVHQTDLRIWVNPPFSEIGRWAEWLVRLNANAAMLIPGNRTGRDWWCRWVAGMASEVRCIRGRVQYVPMPGIAASSCAFDSVLVVYRRGHRGQTRLTAWPPQPKSSSVKSV